LSLISLRFSKVLYIFLKPAVYLRIRELGGNEVSIQTESAKISVIGVIRVPKSEARQQKKEPNTSVRPKGHF
jgi:hypothetical protein